MDTVPNLTKRIGTVGARARDKFNGILLNCLLLIFGPALILIGVHALPPQWRPGLQWPIDGERAAARVESIHLALRHVHDDPHIDNVQSSVNVTLSYLDRGNVTRRAQLAGPWLLQTSTQWNGDAAWLYLEDVWRTIGAGPLEVDMPRDIAERLAVAHQEFAISEQTAANIDRPLRWIALNWLAPEQTLAIRYDPRRPEVAIPESVIERESTRLQGVGILRALAFVLGCILVGTFAWSTLGFSRRWLRALATLLVVGTVLQWAPYVSALVRWTAPGIDIWAGVDIDEVVADPVGLFYDEFRAGPTYMSAKSIPARQGVAWSEDDLSAHALVRWLRRVPVSSVHGSIDEAESALTQAAKRMVGATSDEELGVIEAEVTAIAARKYWIGSSEHYEELRDAVRSELERRKAAPP